MNDKYLAAARTVMGYAVANRMIPANPAAGVKMRVPKKMRLRDRGLTDTEATMILGATLAPPSTQMTPEGVLAHRWVLWLCAYSGARVNEITQLRKQDILQDDGVWVMRITPEAGTTKDKAARNVPLHSHLLDQGFLAVIGGLRPGPIFFDPAMKRGGTDENPQASKVGQRLAGWVRKIGVNDSSIAPNHAWRHRFKTVSRDIGMPTEGAERIQGHATRTVGEGYGTWSSKRLAELVEMLPRYDVTVVDAGA